MKRTLRLALLTALLFGFSQLYLGLGHGVGSRAMETLALPAMGGTVVMGMLERLHRDTRSVVFGLISAIAALSVKGLVVGILEISVAQSAMIWILDLPIFMSLGFLVLVVFYRPTSRT